MILEELILKVQEGSSASRNGNHKGHHAELGASTLRSIQQEPTKEGVTPKTFSFSGRQNTRVTQGFRFCTKVWCINVCSYKSQGIVLGNVTLNYYLFLCAGHIIV